MAINHTSNGNGNGTGRPASRRGRNWLIAGAVVAVAIIPVLTRQGPLKVRVTSPARGPIRSLISTNGKVEPIQNFEAHAPLATTVKHMLVKEGDRVHKGQLLLQLDDDDLRSQAARAQAQMKAAQAEQSDLTTGGTREEVLTLGSQLTKAQDARSSAQRNLDALKRLQQQGAASAGEVQQAQETLQRAQADESLLQQKQKSRYSAPETEKVQAQGTEAQAAYQAAEDALAKSNVRAPFDGVVYALPVKQGAYVQTGDLLLQVGDLSKMLVRSFVDEPDIGRLSIGQKIEVTWDAMPDRIWNGSVSSIPATVKLRGSRNVGEVTCSVDNADDKLLPNVNVGVTVVTNQHNDVLTLAREAVRNDDDKPYVFEVVNGRIERRNIQVSLQNLTRMEVTSGLSADAQIVLSSADSRPLADGARVKVVQ